MTQVRISADKAVVRDFWNEAACGERLLLEGLDARHYRRQAAERYRLEPYIADFADFTAAKGKTVLEVGVGLGADHQRFAEAGALLHGVDLTERAIEHTKRRLELFGLDSKLLAADAEHLPFAANSFDIVYSWGVIHHSPDTASAAREILRVLRPGGRFAVMIYHRMSLVGLMLWLRYAALRGRLGMTLDEIYNRYLESPGTKAYSVEEGVGLFAGAERVRSQVVISHGDLLESGAGQRHEGRLLRLARAIWPRPLIRRFLKNFGLFLLIDGYKPAVKPDASLAVDNPQPKHSQGSPGGA